MASLAAIELVRELAVSLRDESPDTVAIGDIAHRLQTDAPSVCVQLSDEGFCYVIVVRSKRWILLSKRNVEGWQRICDLRGGETLFYPPEVQLKAIRQELLSALEGWLTRNDLEAADESEAAPVDDAGAQLSGWRDDPDLTEAMREILQAMEELTRKDRSVWFTSDEIALCAGRSAVTVKAYCTGKIRPYIVSSSNGYRLR